MEALAATALLREHVPDLKVRVVNIVDLMALEPQSVHPHGLSDVEFDALFTHDRPVIFAFHGYPQLIHRLAYRRTNHANFHVHGFREEGTTTTPFDMVVLNELDRFHLAIEAIKRAPGFAERAGDALELFQDRLDQHQRYIREHGEDMPEIRDWTWPFNTASEPVN